jgi:hypothetical protein
MRKAKIPTRPDSSGRRVLMSVHEYTTPACEVSAFAVG